MLTARTAPTSCRATPSNASELLPMAAAPSVYTSALRRQPPSAAAARGRRGRASGCTRPPKPSSPASHRQTPTVRSWHDPLPTARRFAAGRRTTSGGFCVASRSSACPKPSRRSASAGVARSGSVRPHSGRPLRLIGWRASPRMSPRRALRTGRPPNATLASGRTWMTQALLGVNRDAPGHGEWSLRPMPAPVRGDVETVHGAIHVAWRGDLLRVTIPRGTTLREAALPIDCDSAVAASKTLVAINGRAPTPVPVEAMGRATGRPWCHAIALRNQTAPPDRAVELEVKLLTATLPDLAHIATDAGGMGGMGGQPHGHAQRWIVGFSPGGSGGCFRRRLARKYGTLGHVLFSPLADGVDEVDLPAVALSTNPFEPRRLPGIRSTAPPLHAGCARGALQTSTAPPAVASAPP